MPWKLYENDQGKWCVHKLNADDSKGELVACHDTRGEALAQQRALYASEAKELTDATLSLLKDIAEDESLDKPERAQAVMDEWAVRIKSIPADEEEVIEAEEKDTEPETIEPEVQIVEKKTILAKFKSIGDAIKSWFKDEPDADDGAIGGGGRSTGMSIWKEGNVYWWMARYSNNFRDNDKPPEIISSDSHKSFLRKVKEGKAPLPELWLWHKKEWKVGQAHGLAYDELGFAVAIGTFDADKGYVAEALMKAKDVRVSHGMPISSIVRDEKDRSIIKEHETREISPLPAWAAANKLTGFVVLNLDSNKEDSMAIPDETKKEWVDGLGIDPKTLESLEAANAADASKAMSEGLESKDTTDASAQPATQPEVTEPAVPDAPAESAPAPEASMTVETLRTAVQDAVSGIVNPMVARLDALEASMKQLKETSDAQADVLKGTPTASLASIISQFAQSAIGAAETRVDGRTELAKSKPKEAAAPMDGRTPVPFINEILASGK
jgi:transcriptional regulator of met regulon